MPRARWTVGAPRPAGTEGTHGLHLRWVHTDTRFVFFLFLWEGLFAGERERQQEQEERRKRQGLKPTSQALSAEPDWARSHSPEITAGAEAKWRRLNRWSRPDGPHLTPPLL